VTVDLKTRGDAVTSRSSGSGRQTSTRRLLATNLDLCSAAFDFHPDEAKYDARNRAQGQDRRHRDHFHSLRSKGNDATSMDTGGGILSAYPSKY
jgi:hypothetical protein